MTKRQAQLINKLCRAQDIRGYVAARIMVYKDSYGRVSRRVIDNGHEKTWRRFS